MDWTRFVWVWGLMLLWHWVLYAPPEPRETAYGRPVRNLAVPRWALVLAATATSLVIANQQPWRTSRHAESERLFLDVRAVRFPQDGEEKLMFTWTLDHRFPEARAEGTPIASIRGSSETMQWKPAMHHETACEGWRLTLEPEVEGRRSARLEAPSGWKPSVWHVRDVEIPVITEERPSVRSPKDDARIFRATFSRPL